MQLFLTYLGQVLKHQKGHQIISCSIRKHFRRRRNKAIETERDGDGRERVRVLRTLYPCVLVSYLIRHPTKGRSFDMQLFLEILRQPVADENLVGYGLHGCHFFDRLDL